MYMPLFIELKHRHKRLVRYLDRTELAHLLFTLFLLFEKLLLTGDITAVALGKNVLAHCLDGLSRDYLAADCRLNGYFKKLTRNVFLELFNYLSCSCIRLLGVYSRDA